MRSETDLASLKLRRYFGRTFWRTWMQWINRARQRPSKADSPIITRGTNALAWLGEDNRWRDAKGRLVAFQCWRAPFLWERDYRGES